MTTPPKNILVKCPQCQRVYIDWYTPSLNAPVNAPSGLTQPSMAADGGPLSICSKCGYRSHLRELVEQDGLFQKK